MASEDVFDRLSRTNKRRRKTSRRTKAPTVTYAQSDSDDYLYPGTHGMEENDDDEFQDEIEYGNNKLVLGEDGHEDSAEDEVDYLGGWAGPSWFGQSEARGEEDNEDADEDDIYSLGFIEPQPRRTAMPSSTSSIVSRSSDEPFSAQSVQQHHNSSQQQRNTTDMPRKRNRDDYDVREHENTGSSSDDNTFGMLGMYSGHHPKTRRVTPSPNGSSSHEIGFDLVSDRPSDDTTASPISFASSSSSALRHRPERRDHHLDVGSTRSEDDSGDDFSPFIPQPVSANRNRSTTKPTPSPQRQSIYTQNSIALSTPDQPQLNSQASSQFSNSNHRMDLFLRLFGPERSQQSSSDRSYNSVDSEISDNDDSGDRENALADAFRNMHNASITTPSTTRRRTTGPLTAGLSRARVLPNFHSTNSTSNLTQRANMNRRSFGLESFNTDDGWSTEEEEDDESLARRLQEEEFSSFTHRRSDVYPFESRSSFQTDSEASPMGIRRRLPLQFLMSQDRSRSQTRSTQSTSPVSESVGHSGSEIGEENSISEFGSSIEEESDELDDFIPDFPLYTILTGVAEFERRRGSQQRGPLTERIEFNTLYQSLTSLGGWGSVATNPMNYMDDDELDTSYEGLWRLSEQIGYERERGLSSEARQKLKMITWRQHSILKHQNVASKTTSKGKEKAKQSTQTVEQRCSICLDAYKLVDKLWVLPCHHEFHVDCVNRWFDTSQKCPICRQIVDSS
ncbi:hypothetical protein K450DRAFT_225978 [Umbelopsis ramanniana AG]|uniref:RING-type domain-containing protein n=1 Tax=Umbelopsis ramanniana AG TaxID=1314678 RepID=A0AAD5EIP6_UMBRA|nr:uncharacterized protein K450DRAFT_225978 [Umbelopsis ramanniana AG]KAI8583030.1 hypothetical protein K450DRAFT_225978 [Umbelopsis ramanniana AG]